MELNELKLTFPQFVFMQQSLQPKLSWRRIWQVFRKIYRTALSSRVHHIAQNRVSVGDGFHTIGQDTTALGRKETCSSIPSQCTTGACPPLSSHSCCQQAAASLALSLSQLSWAAQMSRSFVVRLLRFAFPWTLIASTLVPVWVFPLRPLGNAHPARHIR